MKIGPNTSLPFPTNTGVKQGCPNSPKVFNGYFNRVSRYLHANWPGITRVHCPYLVTLSICILLYADDVVLLASSPARLQQLLHLFAAFCDDNGLTVSQAKT